MIWMLSKGKIFNYCISVVSHFYAGTIFTIAIPRVQLPCSISAFFPFFRNS